LVCRRRNIGEIPWRPGFAVDCDFIDFGIGFGALLGDFGTVERHAACGDEFFGFAARGDACGGDYFLEAFRGHGWL